MITKMLGVASLKGEEKINLALDFSLATARRF